MANQPKKYKKFVATAATATLVASAIVPVASAASLSDIAGNTHEEAITALVDAGVINGYPDGTFQPNKTLTRSDVVKLLGKFLVSKGHEVPADYKTNVRFNDLTSASNDELLKYAAVVYDAGVFNGSNGNLLAADNITRENMAVVLVRAFDTLNNIDLVSYVQDQDYKKEVKDLYTAKAEARAAIEVLDFFDITSVANFNPKGSTTRGHFATFLYNTMNADFSAVTGVANSAVSEIKAINNTTVEVTFKDAVDNIEALDFTIDGLEVKNAVVKQTDAKTVVLTTAAQTGDTVYTLNVNAAKAGTFKGISAVVPTAIKLTTPSVQGTIGQQVTVKAEVTVPAGQSKAGIPVTFNIVNDNANLNEKIEVVAYTNAEGVATYTYTRYYKNNDSVTAYATDKSSVFASGKVYWAEGLTVTEVTTGNELANGAKKVYKVTTDNWATETNDTASTADDYNYVNVAFVENTDVTPDKLVRDVKVIDTGITTNAEYPSQVTTGGVQEVRVKVNANGEATFTLTGSNASVTPVVFVDANKNGKYAATELQAQAPTVKFDLKHTLGLTVVAEGVQNAAAINANGTGNGGRDYTVTVTDKDGKLAPEGTVVHVVFPEGSFSTDKAVYFNGTQIFKDTPYTTTVGKEGKAKFTLTGVKDGYATPTVYINNGSDSNKLDKNDLQTVGEQTYFVNAVINNATLVAKVGDKEVTTTSGADTVNFIYTSVDQNGKKYAANPSNYEVSYEVTAQFGDVRANGELVQKGTTKTVKVDASNGVATLPVYSVDSTVATQVTVNASASQVSLPNKAVTVNFTASNELPATYTGNASFNNVKDEITFVGYKTVSYANAAFKNANGVVIDKEAFEALLTIDQLNGDYSRVTSTRDANGNYTFEYVEAGSDLPTPPVPPTTISTTVVTPYAAAVSPKAGVYFSSTITSAIGTGTIEVSDGTDTTTLNINATTATDIASSLQGQLDTYNAANSASTVDVVITAENNKVKIAGKTNTDDAGVVTSTLPFYFSEAVVDATPASAEQAGVYGYDFTGKTLASGNVVTVNGIQYTAVSTGGATVNRTFNVSGTLATDLAALATLITNVDPTFSATATTTAIQLTQRTPGTGAQPTVTLK